MQILLTNDDGIMARGLNTLAMKLEKLGEIYVVAPLEERSATGHGITIWDPIRTKEIEMQGAKKAWAISGTPADCVKLGVQEFLKEDCSLVVSGINNGPNLGTDVLYSGTVSAAIEGAVLGIPSIAVSLASFEYNDFETAAEVVCRLVKELMKNKSVIPKDTLLNVNIPAVKKELLKGYKITRLGVREYENVFDRRVDPRGNVYYWLKGEIIPQQDRDPEIDAVAVDNNYISISPIHFDLTDYRIIQSIKKSGLENIKI